MRCSTNAAHTPSRFSKQNSIRGKECHLRVVRYQSFPARAVKRICCDALLTVFADDHVERQKLNGVAKRISDCSTNQSAADLVQILF